MKNYTITVNGTTYDVTVEEKDKMTPANVAPAPAPQTATANAAPAKDTALAPVPQTKPANANAGDIKVEAGAAGKVYKLEAGVGQKVKKGDAVVIVEAMKMEIPVVAPEDGTVATIEVAVGDMVESGAVLATLNK